MKVDPKLKDALIRSKSWPLAIHSAAMSESGRNHFIDTPRETWKAMKAVFTCVNADDYFSLADIQDVLALGEETAETQMIFRAIFYLYDGRYIFMESQQNRFHGDWQSRRIVAWTLLNLMKCLTTEEIDLTNAHRLLGEK